MAQKTVSGKVQMRRDTAANWTAKNPVLLAGEIGIESDTRKMKAGDGTTAWKSLAYLSVPAQIVVSSSAPTDQTAVWLEVKA